MDLNFLNDSAAVNELLNSYGPLAVLILLVMPLMGEDIIIIPAGFLVGQGHLPFWPTFFFAYVGAFISDAMWFALCYRYGTPLLHKKWFKRMAHPRRMLQAKHQIEKRGAWLIVTARFVPGSRTTTVIVAGLMHMPIWKFTLAECLCLLVTVPMQIGMGYLISHNIGTMGTAGKILTIVGVIVALTVGAFVLNWFLAHRRTKQRAPRSRASWLRRFRPRLLRKSKAAVLPAHASPPEAPVETAGSIVEPTGTAMPAPPHGPVRRPSSSTLPRKERQRVGADD
jgi:membrane protein DedA with SNARE-associated domain